jgi:hypothetical protein
MVGFRKTEPTWRASGPHAGQGQTAGVAVGEEAVRPGKMQELGEDRLLTGSIELPRQR